MENFVITVTLLLIGMGLRRIPAIPDETGNVLNLFVIYISLPALVLLKIPELPVSRSILVPALMPWGLLVFTVIIILVLSRMFHWERAVTGCFLLVIPLGNTSFLGIPMVKAFFGEGAIPYALLYDQLGSFLILATYGSLIIALYGAGKDRPTPGTVVKKVMAFPPFIALILAFALKGFTYPSVVDALLRMLSATLVPLVMIAVGYALTLRLGRETMSQMSIGLGIKLIVAPVAALLFCRLAGLESEAAKVAVFEAGMPPMVSAGALAILANLSPPLTAAFVGIGIVLSFATLPVLYQLII